MPCVYSSRMVKNYGICPIRIEIIHGRHRVVQIYTWAGPLYSNFTPSGKSKNIKAQPMCKFAQLYACHELFLKYLCIYKDVVVSTIIKSGNYEVQKIHISYSINSYHCLL